jgi:hypothetical protein
MTDRELMQQALDALQGNWRTDESDKAIETLRTALAQPDPEPVAWRFHDRNMWCYVDHLTDLQQDKFKPLYTEPPKKKWVGLTEEDIQGLHYQIKTKGMGVYSTEDIYRAIEAKLKKKNI